MSQVRNRGLRGRERAVHNILDGLRTPRIPRLRLCSLAVYCDDQDSRREPRFGKLREWKTFCASIGRRQNYGIGTRWAPRPTDEEMAPAPGLFRRRRVVHTRHR